MLFRSENRFYLDDVELPTLNHFATQGASGGVVSIINVDFVKEVNFYVAFFIFNEVVKVKRSVNKLQPFFYICKKCLFYNFKSFYHPMKQR